MIIKKIKQKNIDGFTLIELMVSVSIFAIVVLVSITAILAIVEANKKAQALDDVINNMNFSVESMVRDLRTGYNYTCYINGSYGACPSNSAVSSITFFSSISGCNVTYHLASNAIYKNISCNGGTDMSLTPSNINVSRFDLYVSNPAYVAPNYTQPIILMVLQAKASVGKQSTEFDLQTLISQRRLNIQ